MLQARRASAHNAPNESQRALWSCHSASVSVAIFSLVITVLMLASPIYMLQVYDRVLTTGHVRHSLSF